MRATTRADAARLNAAIAPAVRLFKPPEDLTVSEWADKYRRLSRETSAEAGAWRTERTPYLKEPMDAFTDPKVRRITMVAASQTGKSEAEMNIIGYIIDQDPGTILYVHPSVEEAKKFSKLRVAPMIRDCGRLRTKVREAKSRDSGNTILTKSFPGGMLLMIGSNTPAALASTPARYIIGDERDRWAKSAGTEGDPWELARARQKTFYNAKCVEVSTPTVKGSSVIADGYEAGTRERWVHKCPECGEYGEIVFSRIVFDHVTERVNGRKVHRIEGPIRWACPNCGCLVPEEVMRRQPARWRAEAPDAYQRGHRSFWLNAFSSPWETWENIVLSYLDAKDDPLRLQVVCNTMFGELWEDRGEMPEEDEMLARRESYGTREDGTAVELPDGVLVLTCGVDTQDDRLEYEVVGYGHDDETWGIRRGVLIGRPDTEAPWRQLDEVIGRAYRYRDGSGLKVSVTFVDSGGHFSQEVHERCRERVGSRVFASKGANRHDAPFISPPRKIPVRGDKRHTCWQYLIGVDDGKAVIMYDLKIQTPGPRYCHFSDAPEAGYDAAYFRGLLSEKMTLASTPSGNVWKWEKIPGHERNEPLDCRNYANAAFKALNPDLDAAERKLAAMREGGRKERADAAGAVRRRVREKRRAAQDRRKEELDEW